MTKFINRRVAAVSVSTSLVAPTALFLPLQSHAIPPLAAAVIPALVRFVLQGAFRTTATRTIATTATRTLASGAVRTATTQYKTVASLGISATGLATVSTAVWALADEHRAEQIWVAGSELVNRFFLRAEKSTQENDRFFYGYRVIDAKSGQIEASYHNVAYTTPGSQPWEMSFNVKPLPHTGLKKVVAFVSTDELGLQPHPVFQVQAQKLVVVADPSEVTLAS